MAAVPRVWIVEYVKAGHSLQIQIRWGGLEDFGIWMPTLQIPAFERIMKLYVCSSSALD